METLRNIFRVMGREIWFTCVKDPRRGLLLFFAASVYLVLFGLLYHHGVINNIPTAILDQDNTATSRSFVEQLDEAQRFRTAYYALNQEDLVNFIDHHHDWVAFEIPKGFEKDIQTGQGTNVLLTIDGSNLVMTSVASIGGIEFVKDFSDQQAKKLFERDLSQPPQRSAAKVQPVGISFRVEGNSVLSYLYFFVLGLSLAAFQQGLLLSVAASFLFDRQPMSEAERALSVPVRMVAKLFPYWLGSQLSIALVLYTATSGFGIPLMGSPWVLLGLTGAFGFLLCSAAAAICGASITELTFTRLSVIYTVPAFILSGFTWPLDYMDLTAQYLAALSPMTYVANNFRDYYLNGYAPYLEGCAWGLLGVGTLLFILAIFLHIRKQKRQQSALSA